MADDNFAKRCFKTFQQAFGQNTPRKKWKEMYICIMAVNCGIKPAYLVDQCCVTAHQLENLIENFHRQNLLTEINVQVFRICEDLFVVNQDKLREHLTAVVKHHNVVFLVDVSHHLDEPKYINNFEYFERGITVFCTDFLEFLDQSESDVEELRNNKCFGFQEKYVSPSMVFGIVLGYPVVYWCSLKSPGNGLSSCKLDVYSLALECPELDSSEFFIVTSFSVPAQLKCDLKPWTKQLLKICKKFEGNLNIEIKHKEVMLPVVAL